MSAMNKFATPATRTIALIEKAIEAAAIDVNESVSRKIKNLAAST